MQYDPDIKRMRRSAWGLFAFNMIGGAYHVYLHQWFIVIAFAGWAFTCRLMLYQFEVTQLMRDRDRVTSAAVLEMLRALDMLRER